MKKLIFLAIVLINTSFINVPKKYWKGWSMFGKPDHKCHYNGTITFTMVIQAENLQKAKRLFNNRIIVYKDTVRGYKQLTYSVTEITAEDILK